MGRMRVILRRCRNDIGSIATPKRPWTKGLAGLLFFSGILASCGRSNAQPVIASSDVIGIWTSGGASLTFLANQDVSVRDLRLASFFGSSCQDLTGSGTWQFLSSTGDSGSSLSAIHKGSLISITLSDPNNMRCDGLEFTSWKLHGSQGLCLSLDPDTPCTGYVFNRQT